MQEEIFDNEFMSLSNEDFIAIYGNEDVLESSNLCEKCSNYSLDEKGKLDCLFWKSIIATGKDDKGEDIVVSCDSFTK